MADVKIGSNRSFGIVFFIVFFTVFLLIALYPLIKNENVRLWSLTVSFIILIITLFYPKFLDPLNKLWFKFGIFLGKIISPIIMGIIFFLVVTPIGLIMRLLGKDLLNLKLSDYKSYWIKKTGPKSKMKNQF